MVVIGALDRMTPLKVGQALAAAIPGARVATIAAVGHMAMVEAPAAVREAITKLMPPGMD